MITTRNAFIELIRRQIYGGLPSDDAEITIGLVNRWLDLGIAAAAKQNYKENIAIDGIGFVNNSFYTKFTGLSITGGQNFLWQFTLPNIPLGIGANHSVSTLQLVDSDGRTTQPLIPLSENQKTFYQGMRNIPNKTLFYYEGKYGYVVSTLILSQYTANVTMVSGGTSSDLTSTINVPDDYFPTIVEYIKQQLNFERNQPVDVQQDGVDAIRTT